MLRELIFGEIKFLLKKEKVNKNSKLNWEEVSILNLIG